MPDLLFYRLPKYIQIKEALRKEMEEGFLKDGQQLPSETVLIERFEASKMTVIRALQELVQEGYLRRVQGKGTYVTHPGNQGPSIGVFFSQGINPAILDSLEETARKLGYEMVFCRTCLESENHQNYAARNIHLNVAGVILVSSECEKDPHLDFPVGNLMGKDKIPTVILNVGAQISKGVVCVQCDQESAMAELTEEVVQCGHRRILLVRSSENQNLTVLSRIRGFFCTTARFEEVLELAELVSVNEQDSLEEKRQHLQALIEEYEPTVLMAIDDYLAVDMIRRLKYMSSTLQNRISITGFDDLPFADVLDLTTVRQPFSEMGEKAVELLDILLQGEHPQSVTLRSKVIIRSSLSDIRNEMNPVESAVAG